MTLQCLEDAFGQVLKLERDLSAVIVHQEEVGHYEQEKQHLDYYEVDNFYYVDIPRIAEPDVQKRDAARQQLQQVYDTSNWYSARYVAGRAFGAEVNSQAIDWIEQLAKVINDHPVSKYIKVGEHEVYEDVQSWDYKRWYSVPAGTVEDFDNVPIPENIEVNNNAREDLKKLYNLTVRTLPGKLRKATGHVLGLGSLKVAETELIHDGQLNEHELEEVYEYSKNKGFRSQAGKKLGYSSIRICVHEHPLVSKLIGGIAAAGAASGLGYVIYQYMTR